MVSIYDVHPRKLIEEMAAELKKMPEMAPPEWSIYVKTGNHNMRPPMETDWWYIRSAAIMRSVYKLGPIGVSKLRTKYGGRKNMGHKPDKTIKASGNIIRKILQKLEIIGFIKQTEAGVHKGRAITPKGKSFVDKIVIKIKEPYKSKSQKEEKPKKESKETIKDSEKKLPVEKKVQKKEKEQKSSDDEKTKEVKK
jgi:small subunit ribosomal protein S19e